MRPSGRRRRFWHIVSGTMNRPRHRPPAPTRLRAGLGALLLLAAFAAPAAPPLSERDQSALDRAVLDYESGRAAEALIVFEALAGRGVPAAQFNLGLMHLNGEVPRPDLAQARRWLTAAGEGGFVTAQLLLGQAWENGRFGRRDLPLSTRWYELAATAGSVDAQVAMGTAFFLGRGARQDMAEAARWYREAAKGGDIGAQYLLASMYEHGDGVERDLRLARYWYQAAADAGDEAAPSKLKEIDARLAAPN